jgi:predicted nuclease of predicted toxin-antitoxin system
VKLLFGQNLSYSLVALLSDIFNDTAHVRDFNLEEADDQVLWDFSLFDLIFGSF